MIGPCLPVAYCRSCGTRLTFERMWVTINSKSWSCHCEGCVDGGYGHDGLGTRVRSGEGTSPWEALDDCAAMQWDCEPEELLTPKEGT